MQIIKGTTNIRLKSASIVTMGKFDGLHRGHQALIHKVKTLGHQTGFLTVVFTFDRPPAADFHPQILTSYERELWLEKAGMDILIEYPFSDEVRAMSAEDFVRHVLADDLQAVHLVMGSDFRFGYQRRGDYQMLTNMQSDMKYGLWNIPKVMEDGEEISSTRIRKALAQGQIELVNQLLGYNYFICGTICHGRQLGRTIDMPTINILPEEKKLLPPFGVYCSEVDIEGKRYYGVTNIGKKPTVGDGFARGVETHLLDVHENLYNKEACVSLKKFLRPEHKFDSIEALKAQMHKDEQEARNYFYKM